MEKVAIIRSREIRLIPIAECGEHLVDTRESCPGLRHRIAEYIEVPREREDACFVRRTVADMLNAAMAAMPAGHGLEVRCGLRSIETQTTRYCEAYGRLRSLHPDWGAGELEDRVEEFFGAPDLAPHCTGGAVDLFPLAPDGSLLDIGCRPGEHTPRAVTVTDVITPAQQSNRDLFTRALLSSGLVNFPGEVWHWCYGESDWAAYGRHASAIYGMMTRHGK